MAYKVREAEIKFKIVTLKCRPSQKIASPVLLYSISVRIPKISELVLGGPSSQVFPHLPLAP